MNKKGQVTIFIIIALVLVVGVVLFFVFRGGSDIEENILPEIAPLKLSFENCLKDEFEDIVYLSASQGGYVTLPQSYIAYSFQNLNQYPILIPYYLGSEGAEVPDVDRLEKEFSFGIKSFFKSCLDKLDSEYVVSADYDRATASFDFDTDKIKSEIYLPMSFKMGDSLVRVNKFEFQTDSNFFKLYNVAEKLTSSQKDFGDFLCLSCIPRISSENGVITEITEVEGDTSSIVIYSIQDIENENIIFNFAHKFGGAESE